MIARTATPTPIPACAPVDKPELVLAGNGDGVNAGEVLFCAIVVAGGVADNVAIDVV